MANILGTAYMSVLFLFTALYMAYYIRKWIIELKAWKRKQPVKIQEKPVETAIDIVGKSTSVFLAPLTPAGIEPMMSEDLEPEQQADVEFEPEISPDEVEISLNRSVIPDADELDDYSEGSIERDDLSQGLTFEQIGHAIDVVEGRKAGEHDEHLAGETLSNMPSDFLDVLCKQADYEVMVNRLIDGYLDFPTKMKPAPVSLANFDINKYV